MKGFRFYLEYPNSTEKNKPHFEGDHEGNVLALVLDDDNSPLKHYDGRQWVYEAIGAVYHHSNSGVCGCSVNPQVLRERFKRISEEKAREIHPRLFQRLDNEDHYAKA